MRLTRLPALGALVSAALVLGLTGCASATDAPAEKGSSSAGFDWANKGLGFSAGVHLNTKPKWIDTLSPEMIRQGWLRDSAHDAPGTVGYRNAESRAYVTVSSRALPDQVSTAMNDRSLTEHTMKEDGYPKQNLQVVTIQLNGYDDRDGMPSVTFLGGFRRAEQGGMTSTYGRAFANQQRYLSFTIWEPLAAKDTDVLKDGADWAGMLAVHVPGAGSDKSAVEAAGTLH